MSNTPGINPLTPDIEEVRHSDDPAFDDSSTPGTPEGEDEAESDEETAARIQRKTLDLA